jgi:hypothetical protein
MNAFIQRAAFLVLAAFATPATSAAAASDPCTLLTKADAVKILGGAVTGGHRGNECTYRLAGTGKNVYAAADSTPSGLAYFNEVKKTGKPVNGLGAPAYFVAGSLAVMKGGTLVQVGLIASAGDVSTMNPKLPALVKLVLSRL